MSIEIRNVNKKFGNFTALDDINITVPTGKLTTLLVRQAAVKPPCCVSLQV